MWFQLTWQYIQDRSSLIVWSCYKEIDVNRLAKCELNFSYFKSLVELDRSTRYQFDVFDVSLMSSAVMYRAELIVGV